MKTQEELAAAIKRNVLREAVGAVGPGLTFQMVLERVAAVDFMFDDFARFILTGKDTPDHGNEPTDEAQREVVFVPDESRIGDEARDHRGSPPNGRKARR